MPVAEQNLGPDQVGPRRGQARVADAYIETRTGVDLERADIEPAVREGLRGVDEAVGLPSRLAAEILAVQDAGGREQIPAGLAGEDAAQGLRHAACHDVGAGGLGALIGLVAQAGDHIHGKARSALQLIDLGSQPLDTGPRVGGDAGLLLRLG